MPDSQTIIPENTVISAFPGIHYFNIILENVKFTTVAPFLSPGGMSSTHLETLELRYEAITWKYTEGNIIYRDSWNDRCCA